MTYCLNKKSPISHEESRLLQLLNKAFPCITRPVVLKWSVTQALDVTEPAGRRGRYLTCGSLTLLEGSEKNLHFVHMVYTTAWWRCGRAEGTQRESRKWPSFLHTLHGNLGVAERHPREVVILACRNFEG
nr:PI-PLC X domain-containing protein 1-like [Macaca nemestrina]